MSQKIFNKINQIYTFITDKNKESVIKGDTILPICYGVIMDHDKDLSIIDIPLDKYSNQKDMEEILKSMGKVLKENNANVKMFMYTTQATISRVGDTKSFDALIFSSRDCYGNTNQQVIEITKGMCIVLKTIEERLAKKWTDGKKKKAKVDTLLDSIWNGYNKAKST